MRIVGGSARGRTLATPRSDDVIRPTADRARETIFNVLGQSCDGLTVLDLYAGTGALGLEAVSRGAIKAVLVDKAKEALELCRQNTATLKFGDRVEIVAGDALKIVERLGTEGRVFELVFADAPYALKVGVAVLEALENARVVSHEGVAVIETAPEEAMPESHGHFAQIDRRVIGAAAFSIYRLTKADP
ncbi:MAG: 16S rRNA (guanine(966)-N(2))-methyltransferase RsmD [Myxococcaceae bacterium]